MTTKKNAGATTVCPNQKCGKPISPNKNLIGKNPTKHGYHAHCEKCKLSVSNATDPKNRVIIWDDEASNIYPNDPANIKRMKKIVANCMNTGNRKKKPIGMRSENSEDALTWSVFNMLEKHKALDTAYSLLSGTPIDSGTEIYYWGYNDPHSDSPMIKTYKKVLKTAGEPDWRGGYSEPDILLYNPKHGLINIEVKYKSPNDDKLKDKSNQNRNARAQQMLDTGKAYVQKHDVKDWVWYELLRMWVPGCLVAEKMGLKKFTLVNLLPQKMKDSKNGKAVVADMKECLKDDQHKFKQETWENFLAQDFVMEIRREDQKFDEYLRSRLPKLKF